MENTPEQNDAINDINDDLADRGLRGPTPGSTCLGCLLDRIPDVPFRFFSCTPLHGCPGTTHNSTEIALEVSGVRDFAECGDGSDGSCGAFLLGFTRIGKLPSWLRKIFRLSDDGAAAVPRVIKFPDGRTLEPATIATRTGPMQNRRVAGGQYSHGGYFKSEADAQTVLDEFHSGQATVLGLKRNGDIVVRSSNVTGVNVNPRAGYPAQPTDVFFIKGSVNPVVVPYNPAWK